MVIPTQTEIKWSLYRIHVSLIYHYIHFNQHWLSHEQKTHDSLTGGN